MSGKKATIYGIIIAMGMLVAGAGYAQVNVLQKISGASGWHGQSFADETQFGLGVAWLGDIDGDGVDDVAVGAPFADRRGDIYTNGHGEVWILFLDDNGTVKATQRIAEGKGGFTGTLDPGDRFGWSVANIGDLDDDGNDELAVGAIQDDDGGSQRGALWVLFLGDDGTVTSHQKVSDTEGNFTGTLINNNMFGFSIAGIGDLNGNGVEDMVVGMPYDDTHGPYTGAVWVLFMNDDGTVESHTRISDGEGGFSGVLQMDDYFGYSVANIGDLDDDFVTDIAIGAPGDEENGLERGAIWVVFLDTDGTVKTQAKVNETNGGFGGPLSDYDQFGYAVAGLGDLDVDGMEDIVVGAPFDDDASAEAGAVYVLFMNSNGTVNMEQKIRPGLGGFGGPVDMLFGSSIVNIGDLDNDTNVDIMVGEPRCADGGSIPDPGRGAVWTLFMDINGTVMSEQKISDTEGNFIGTLDNGDYFGLSSANIGDLDQDGVDDMAVGAPFCDDGGLNRGAVWILFMNDDGTVKASQKISQTMGGFGGALEDEDYFGSSIAAIGDINGDVIIDLAVGAMGSDGDGSNQGAVWILFMMPDGTVGSEQTIDNSVTGFMGALGDDDYFGYSCAALGDIDGDFINDIAVGAVGDEGGGADRGAIYIFFLEMDGTITGYQKISDIDGGFTGTIDNNDYFGYSIAKIGDLNSDGYTEIAVGVPYEHFTTDSDGAVWILSIDENGLVIAQQEIDDGVGGFGGFIGSGDYFGSGVAGIGDIDGDGIPDLAIGEEDDDGSGNNEGGFWLMLMNDDFTVRAYTKITFGTGGFTGLLDTDDHFGRSIIPLGDLGDDGDLDIAVGAYMDDDGGLGIAERGAMWVLSLDNPDIDRDGVYWSADGCSFENASYFDREGDGCIDNFSCGRHVEYWGPGDTVFYFIQEDGVPTILDGSDFYAIQNGMNAWRSIPGSDFDVAYGGTVTQQNADILDRMNLITFTDTEYNFSGAVLAVGIATSFTTPTSYQGTFYRPGQVVDCDMIFNPTKRFKTETSGGEGVDVHSVVQHEAGHLNGISHSAVKSSTMYYVLPGGIAARSFTPDDMIAFIKAYPDPFEIFNMNYVNGYVLDGSSMGPVTGAAVFVIDIGTGDTTACAVTKPDGQYEFLGIPDGNYVVAAHALDGTTDVGYLTPGYINPFIDSLSTVTYFIPEYYNTGESSSDDPTLYTTFSLIAPTTLEDLDIITNIDETPPTVISTVPGDLEAGVAVEAAVSVLFSERIDLSSVSGNFNLEDDLAAGVSGYASVIRDDSVISFLPSAPFSYATGYTLILDTGISDLAGNPMAAPHTVSFTTEARPTVGVTNLAPNKGVISSVVTINGFGFEPDGGLNTVRFTGESGTIVTPVIDAYPNRLVVIVPDGTISGNVTVEVGLDVSTPVVFTVLSSTEVTRGVQIGSQGLGVLPRKIAVVPDGSYAYVATTEGAMAVDLNVSNFLDTTAIHIGAGLNDIDVTPGGKLVYGVSRLGGTIHIIDSDPNSVTHNQTLDDMDTEAEPLGICIGPGGSRAYIPTTDGEIQVWDVKEGSATYKQHIGTIDSPDPNIRRELAIDPAGNHLLALGGTGKVLVYDLGPNTLLTQISVGLDPRGVDIDPTGVLAYVTDAFGKVAIVSLNLMQKVTDVTTGGSLRDLDISPAGLYCYAANRELNNIDVIDLDVNRATYRSVVANISAGINPVDVKLAPDGLTAYSISAQEKTFIATNVGAGPVITSIYPVAGPPGAMVTFAGTGLVTGTVFDNAQYTSAAGGWITVSPPDATSVISRTFAAPGAVGSGPAYLMIDTPGGWESSNQVQFDALESTSTFGDLKVKDKMRLTSLAGFNDVVAMSPTGDQMLMGGQNGELVFYDTDEGSATFNQIIGQTNVGGVPNDVEDIAITPDGKRAYVSVPARGQVYVINTNRSSSSYTQKIDSVGVEGSVPPFVEPSELEISPDGGLCIVFDQTITPSALFFVDILEGSSKYNNAFDTIQVYNATDIAFHPAGGEFTYLTTDWEQSIRVIDTGRGSPTFGNTVANLTFGGYYTKSLDFAPTGEFCYVLSKTFATNITALHTIQTTTPNSPFDTGPPVNINSSNIPSTGGERITVSPRGDRAIIHVRTAGIYEANLETLPPTAAPFDLGGGITEHLDQDYTVHGTHVYAVAEGHDSLFYYEYSYADSLFYVSGNNQQGVIQTKLPAPLRVMAKTDLSNPQPGITVTFSITSGGGTFAATSTATQSVVTNKDGVGEVYWRLGSPTGLQTCEAVAPGLVNSPIVFSATAVEDPNTLPLVLVETIPANNTTDVSVTTSVLATFSRAVTSDTTNIEANFFLHKDGEATPVPALLGITDGSRKLSLTPAAQLDPGTDYWLQVLGGLQDDAAGTLDNPDSILITTELLAPPLALNGVNPPSASAGAVLTLSGTGFDTTPANNSVIFNAATAEPDDAGTDYLSVIVPLAAISGALSVDVGGSISNTIPFTVLVPDISPADSIIATVGTGYATKAAVIDPNGEWVYAVSPEGDVVVPIDMVTLISATAIPVGDHPISIDIHPDGTYAYVANFGSGSISIIDVNSPPPLFQTVVETPIVGGSPIDLVVSPDGSSIYVANAGSNELDVIDGNALSSTHHEVIASATTGGAVRSVHVTPDGSRIYIGTNTGYIVMDATDYSVIRTVGTGSATRSVHVTPDGAMLIVLTTEGDVLIIDIVPGSSTEDKVLTTVSTGGTTRSVKVSPDGALLYLVQEESDEIIVISLEVIGSVAVIDGHSQQPPPTVNVTIQDTLYAGEDPETIVFDPTGSGRAVVPNAGPQTMTFLDVSAPGAITLFCPPDSIIPPLAADPVYVLDGFEIMNTSDVSMTYQYHLTEAGPAMLDDNGDPASLAGTTPLLAPGASYIPPDAALILVETRTMVQETVTYHVNAVQEPALGDSCHTVITIEAPNEVLITNFQAEAEDFGVKLMWKLSLDEEIEGFRIYRAHGDREEGEELHADGLIARDVREFFDRDVTGGETYLYSLGVVRADGTEILSAVLEVTAREMPLALFQNYPNPFNPSTKISFSLPEKMHVNLTIYNVEGKRIRTLVNSTLSRGLKEVTWDGRDGKGVSVSSGVYFYRLKTKRKMLTKKLVLLR